METQFSQSGQFQKEKFSAFIKELVQKFKPEQIYSFGKNIDFKVNNGCFIENHSTDKYHYFLLMVTESVTRIEHEVQDFANNRFFITVYNDDQILYSRDGTIPENDM